MWRRAAVLALFLLGTPSVSGSGAIALSCPLPSYILQNHGDDVIAAVGVVLERDDDSASVSVSRWLAGTERSTPLTLDDSDLDGSDRDGRSPLETGVEYVFMATPVDRLRDTYYVDFCMPAVPQASAQGRDLLHLIEQHFALPETDTAPVMVPGYLDPGSGSLWVQSLITLVTFGVPVAAVVALLRRRRGS